MTKEELEFRISAQYSDAIRVSQYDDKEVFVSMQVRGGSTYTVLTTAQAKELIEALSKIVEAQE